MDRHMDRRGPGQNRPDAAGLLQGDVGLAVGLPGHRAASGLLWLNFVLVVALLWGATTRHGHPVLAPHSWWG